eukprot:5413164-Prymnesium_polylepis.1
MTFSSVSARLPWSTTTWLTVGTGTTLRLSHFGARHLRRVRRLPACGGQKVEQEYRTSRSFSTAIPQSSIQFVIDTTCMPGLEPVVRRIFRQLQPDFRSGL